MCGNSGIAAGLAAAFSPAFFEPRLAAGVDPVLSLFLGRGFEYFLGRTVLKNGPDGPNGRVRRFPYGEIGIVSHALLYGYGRRRAPAPLRDAELAEELLEGFFSGPVGHRHRVEIDRRNLDRLLGSGAIDLPPPRSWRPRAVLHHHRIVVFVEIHPHD